MAADPQFVANINQLLENSLLPDTSVVKAATEGLQAQYKNPAIVPALFQILASPAETGVRQLAGVELRKRIAKSNKAWKNQAPEIRSAVKSKLLEIVKEEPNSSVRNSAARIVCEIARRELPQNAWPELLPFLFAAAEQGNGAQRHSAIFVFYALLEVFNDDEAFAGYLPQIMQLFSKAINDPELPVRVMTVRGLGKVGELLETDSTADLAAIQSAIPQMVQVLQQSFEAGESDSVTQILDVFDNFAFSELPILNNFLGDLLVFLLTMASREDFEDELREAALNSVIFTITYKRQKIQQLQISKNLIPLIMAIVPTSDFEEQETNPATLALRILDTMATELPPSNVWPPLQEQLQVFAQSPDPAFRGAGIVALGMVCEGISETLRPQMDSVWQFIETGLKDSESRVRRAAAIALGQFCDHIGTETVRYHAAIMPALMQMIVNPDTQLEAARALDRVLENLGEDIKLYLQPVMEVLAGYLDQLGPDANKSIIASIGSAAHASKRDFLPYFPKIMEKLTPYLQFKDTTNTLQMDYRAITQDTIGTFADAVGPDAFRPYFSDMMSIAYDAFELNQPRLRECSFIFFSIMAKVFGEDFSMFLPQIMPKVFESFRQSEHENVGDEGDGAAAAAALAAASGAADDDDEDEFIDLEDLQEPFTAVSSAIAIEKEVAADSVGDLFRHTKSGYLPYLQQTVQDLLPLLQHFSSGIRKSAMTSLFTFIQVLKEIQNPEPWKPGVSVPVPVSNDLQHLIDIIMQDVLTMWEDESDMLAAITLCEMLAETIREVGPALISKHTSEVADIAMKILEKKSTAQVPDPDEEIDEEDSSEYENLLISSAMELVGAIVEALGGDFQQALPPFLPQIVKYYGPGKTTAERSATTSTLGLLSLGMKEHITPFTVPILTVLSHGVTDEDPGVRTNATFASGVLIEHSQTDLTEHYSSLLTALQPALALPADKSQAPEVKGLKDNAIGCLARMVRKSPSTLPLEETFPLIFSGLPLLYDEAEWAPVIQLTIDLIQANSPVAQQHVDDILRLYAHVLAIPADSPEDGLGAELRGQLVTFISHLNTQLPDKVQAAGLSSYLV